MKTKIELTEKEIAIFKELASDAPDWNGSPLWNADDTMTRADNAVLGSLVKKGLVTTMQDDVHDIGSRRKNTVQYVSFTELGCEYAETIGINPERLKAL